ncbi:hypothetical protein ACFY4C_06720 [Actinomadura viridis]|uniref:hypothetical protein n=1 Tax=Actinomadura viridis TaxID=58110 RepID=UPI003686274B
MSPDGDRWVGGSWHDIVVGDFAGTEIRLNEDGDWDHWEFTPGACFLGREHVLVAGRHSDHEYRHLLFRSDTLRPAGHITYLPESLSEQDNRFLYGDSDGTWLTMHIPDRARPDEGRLRRWTLVDPLDT